MTEWRIKYEQLLEDMNVEYDDVKKFVHQFMPQKLYRYRKFDEYYKSNIMEGQVYLSFPYNYNDPFDCAVKFDYSKYAEASFGKKITQQLFSCMAPTLEKHYNDTFEGFRKYIKIACFSELNNSMLMWSHYAENHSGFCIEYDTKKCALFEELALPVIYKKERYDATRCLKAGHDTKCKNIACNPVMYKSKDWEYEKEWRLYGTIDYWKGKRDFLNMYESISAIYIGASIKKEDEDKVNDIRKWGKNQGIPVYKMQLDDNTYNLVT